MIDKKQMTEEDIKLRYITPAITSKWSIDYITMETKITDGKINLKGNLVFREKSKKADYILYINANKPIAIVEAKDNNHNVSFGLQQAMTYAKMLDVPFAYSSKDACLYTMSTCLYSYFRSSFFCFHEFQYILSIIPLMLKSDTRLPLYQLLHMYGVCPVLKHNS